MKTTVLVGSSIVAAVIIAGAVALYTADSEPPLNSDALQTNASAIEEEEISPGIKFLPKYDLPRLSGEIIEARDEVSIDERVIVHTVLLPIDGGVQLKIGSAYRKYLEADDDLRKKSLFLPI